MTAPPERRGAARWALVLGVAVFVFTRVRAHVPAWVAMHRWLRDLGVPDGLRHLDGPLLLLGAAWLGARLASRSGATRELGLRGSFARGLRFGAIAGIPMLLQGAVGATGVRLDGATLRGVLLAPLVEEVFFRGLLVAVAVRCGGLWFWPAAIASGLLFGSAHVPWVGDREWHHLPTFLITAAGGVWYAWIARAFAWNLWTTIALHAAMNAAWMVFALGGGAVGGLWPNIGRGLTIALGTVLTLRHRRSRAS